ncbi:hypothetical protein KAR91_69620 [Candidatus Pacearchaeota archaeon]|nr:hypothetical protein [Candidatus Pacearchaeota archaeon]
MSLDLAEPVAHMVERLKENWSLYPVELTGVGGSGNFRGGFNTGDGLKHPRIIAVEGEMVDDTFIPRKGKTKLTTIEGKTEITVYKVGVVPTEKGYDKKFANSETHLTIDIYNAERKERLDLCLKEVKRICYLLNGSIGGNYTRLRVGDDTDLTNRRTGLWRSTLEIYLIKVDDYIGS